MIKINKENPFGITVIGLRSMKYTVIQRAMREVSKIILYGYEGT
jgi:hypothetical protein